MQLNETLVVAFLVVVILILIFSKITIGTTTDETALIKDELKKLEEKIVKPNVNTSINQDGTSSTTIPTPFNAQGSDLLSPEFKKQLDEIQNRFYYDNCRYSRL